MRVNRLFASLFVLSLTAIAGCSGSSSSNPPPAGSTPASLTMIDAPPAGVTVISFEVNVTGAALNPGGVDLLAGKGPIQIEVKRLEVETGFLGTTNVAPGTYSSLNLTFANPQLTFKNDSTATIAGCAAGQVCKITPAAATLTSTINFAPGLVISSNSPIGLQVDVKLNNLLSNSLGVDFSVSGAVTVAQSQAKPEGELEDIEDIFGTVQNKGSNTFDLKTSRGNTLTGIQVDNNTKFEGFDAATTPCTANPQNFTCVANGQMVEVDLKMQPSGALLARKVEQENEDTNEEEVEGIVFSVNASTSSFQMVALENLSTLPSSVLGNPMNVTVLPGARFQVEGSGRSSNPQFSAVGSMTVGQNVQVRRTSGDGSTIPVATDRVRLRLSRFTGKVNSKVDANTFVVDNLPSIFGPGAQITVNTTSQTRFEGVANVSALNAPPNADTVSLRGLLFNGTPITLAAKKVRKR